MPSPRHDAINGNFKEDPGLVVHALRNYAGINVPENLPIQIGDPHFNDRVSTDFHADTVVTVGQSQNPARVIIVEIQQGGAEEKRPQLPRYAAEAWLMYRCRIDVLVVCPSATTADKFRDPIETSLPGYRFQAAVLGPKEIPLLTDPKEVAANPSLAALQMMAHGHVTEVRETFVEGLEGLQHDYAMKYYDHVQRMSADRAGKKLEELVKKTTVYSDFVREHQAIGQARGEAMGQAIGKVEGEAKALLLMLSARGIDVSEEARTRITMCEDLGQLETWVRRAATVESAEDLFL